MTTQIESTENAEVELNDNRVAISHPTSIKNKEEIEVTNDDNDALKGVSQQDDDVVVALEADGGAEDEIEIQNRDNNLDLECPTENVDDVVIDIDSMGVKKDCKKEDSSKSDIVKKSNDDDNELLTSELNDIQKMAKTKFLADRNRRIEALAEQRYHLPNNSCLQDWLQYFANNHPLFGICFHDRDHPLGSVMRAMCFFASIVFGLAITNAFWLWARNDEDNSTLLYTVETSAVRGGNLTGYIVDVNDENNVEVTKDILLLWTLGGLVHGLFDNLIWTLSICACCNPGGRCEILSRYKKFGVGLLTFFILIIVAMTSLSVLLRTVLEEEEDTDVTELRTAGAFDDEVELSVASKENYEFLMSYFVELALEFFFYFPLIGSVMFSGILEFLGLPQFKGRKYELALEEKELQEILEHPELYLQADEDDKELDDEFEAAKPNQEGDDADKSKSILGYFQRLRRNDRSTSEEDSTPAMRNDSTENTEMD